MARQREKNHLDFLPFPREVIAAVAGEEDFVELLRRELVASATAAPRARFPAHTASQLRGHGGRPLHGISQDLPGVVGLGRGVCGPMKPPLPLCTLSVFV
jgi:hypothetical protein